MHQQKNWPPENPLILIDLTKSILKVIYSYSFSFFTVSLEFLLFRQAAYQRKNISLRVPT